MGRAERRSHIAPSALSASPAPYVLRTCPSQRKERFSVRDPLGEAVVRVCLLVGSETLRRPDRSNGHRLDTAAVDILGRGGGLRRCGSGNCHWQWAETRSPSSAPALFTFGASVPGAGAARVRDSRRCGCLLRPVRATPLSGRATLTQGSAPRPLLVSCSSPPPPRSAARPQPFSQDRADAYAGSPGWIRSVSAATS